jgi:hypothetical protein
VKSNPHKMEYWVEVNHSDLCDMCSHGTPGCALGKPDQRIRVAQFVYFMEAIDYAQECQRRGVRVWLRKPRFVSFPKERTVSEYSLYDVKDGKPAGLLQTPIVLDGKPGIPA